MLLATGKKLAIDVGFLPRDVTRLHKGTLSMNDRQPYSPPEAPVKDVGHGRPRPVKGIVMGTLTDLGGSILMSITLSIVVSIWLASQGMSPEQIKTTLENTSPTSALSLLAAALGIGFSILGGFVCATYARKDIYGCALIMALVVSVIGYLLGGNRQSLAMSALMVLITFAAVVFGAWLYGRKHPEHDRYREGSGDAV